MELLLTPLVLYLGYRIGRYVARRCSLRARGTIAVLRPLRSVESGYRDAGSDEKSHSLDEVFAALRGAGLVVEEAKHGFEIRSRASKKAWMEVHLRDQARITLSSLDPIDHQGDELVFEVALALFPLFGPMTVTEAAFGSFVVDGTNDADALAEDRRGRVKRLASAITADLESKLTVYEVGAP